MNCSSFQLEQLLFAFDSPAITGEFAVAGDDTMAGNDDGDGVGGACAGDGTDRGGLADVGGNPRVAAGFAARNAAESFPDAHLKGGGAEIEREIERGRMLGELGKDLGERRVELRVRVN